MSQESLVDTPAEMDGMADTVAELVTDVAALETAVTTLDGEVDAVVADVAALTTELTDLEVLESTSDARISQAVAAANRLAEAIEGLLAQVAPQPTQLPDDLAAPPAALQPPDDLTPPPVPLTAGRLTTVLGSALSANPTGTIGLTAVNGTLNTYIRSDGAPALSQAIAPTWSAQHIFSLAGNLATPTILMTSTQPVLAMDETDQAADEKRWAMLPAAKVLQRRSATDTGGASIIWESITRGTGTAIADMRWGDSTNNNTYTFNSSGLSTFSGSVSAATLIPSGGAAPTNGLYLPNSNNPAISANSTKVLDCISTAARVTGNLSLTTAGNGILIKEGTNATMGRVTLVAGAAVVNTTKVTATSEIILTGQALGTIAVPVARDVTARTAGTSFTITSANVTDTSIVAWVILEPA